MHRADVFQVKRKERNLLFMTIIPEISLLKCQANNAALLHIDFKRLLLSENIFQGAYSALLFLA